MLAISHMHTDLVRSARLQPRLDQGIASETLQHAPMRNRAFGVLRGDSLPQPVCGVSANRRVDGALVLHQIIIDERSVSARDAVRSKLRRERFVRHIVFGNHQ